MLEVQQRRKTTYIGADGQEFASLESAKKSLAVKLLLGLFKKEAGQGTKVTIAQAAFVVINHQTQIMEILKEYGKSHTRQVKTQLSPKEKEEVQ